MNKHQFRQLHESEDTSTKVIDYVLDGKSENEFFDVKYKMPHDDISWAEIIKDIIGFYNNKGGYILFGIDDDFNIVGDKKAIEWDTKLVNEKVGRYTGQIRVKFSCHSFQGKHIGIIFIPTRHENGLPAWAENDAPNKSNGNPVFRKRDIFLRINDETRIQDTVAKVSDLVNYAVENRSVIKYINFRMNKLIQPDYESFIGRDEYRSKILDFLSPDHIALIVNIGGVGGVGKSAIATWATHEIYNMNLYDVIISISAKDKELSTKGIVQLERSFFTYEDLLKEIIDAYEYQFDEDFSTDKLENIAKELLDLGNCLLFIDNYETIEDTRIEEFLQNKFVTKRSQRHKALITSRTSVIPGEYSIKLPELSREEMDLLLIEFSHLMNNSRLSTLPNEVKIKLFEYSGGLPLGLKYVTAGYINLGMPKTYTMDEIPNKLNLDQMLIYCFKGMFKTFDNDTQYVLMTLALFNEPIDFLSLLSATALSEVQLQDSLRSLTAAMIVKRDISVTSEEKLSILPITRRFALSEIRNNGKFRNLEIDMKKRVAEHNRRIDISIRQSNDMKSNYPEYTILTQNQNIAIEILKEAFKHKGLSRDDSARFSFQKASKIDPMFAIPHYEWALFEWEKGNISNADALFDTASHASSPKKVKRRILLSWATMLDNVGNYRGAAEKIKIIIDEDKQDYVQRHKHAYYLSRAGYYGRAEKLFRELLSDIPNGESKQIIVIQHSRIHNFLKQDDKESARKLYLSLGEEVRSTDRFFSLRRMLGL